MLAPLPGVFVDPEQSSRLHQAYEMACEQLNTIGPLDEVVRRKLNAALMRYAQTDERREPEEIARLAVMHVRIASAPQKL